MISESTLLVRYFDTYLRKSNLRAFTQHLFYIKTWAQILTVEVSVSALNFQTVLGGNVVQASVREQRKVLGEGRVSFQPHVLKHSTDQCLHVTP